MFKYKLRSISRTFSIFKGRVISDVVAVEIDAVEIKPIEYIDIQFLIGKPESSNKNKIVFFGPSISKPRWYQFWRWHKFPEYRRQCKKAVEDFYKLFGKQALSGRVSCKYPNRANEPKLVTCRGLYGKD